MEPIRDYIQKTWKKTIRGPEHESFEKIPYPYTTPCIDEMFTNFFYWDTYFTNLGLLRDGYTQQAKNNLRDIAFFIKYLGYMPNADQIPFRSQPPVFTRGVYDYYEATEDKDFVKEMLPYIQKEFDFWFYDRMTPTGLNQYGSLEPKVNRVWYLDMFSKRANFTEEEKKLDPDGLCQDLLAIAESGWDLDIRFAVKGNRFACRQFVPIDLNCLLYDAERKASYLAKEIGEEELSKKYFTQSEERKEKIKTLLFDQKSHLYLDYNFKQNTFSSLHSTASFYPYALGIYDKEEDKEPARNLLKELLLPHGLSVAPYRGKDEYFQWDYPYMWPTNVYFAYLAFKNLGLKEEAKMVKEKYMNTVETVYQRTGKLYEKYDSLTGDIAVNKEYDTPAMMGWTAGIYDFLSDDSL